jgi:hypothetical protein
MGTFMLVCVTWVFFRARDFPRAFDILSAMLGAGGGDVILRKSELATIALIVGFILVAHWLLRNMTLEDAARRIPWWGLAVILALMACAIVMSPGDDRAFIYFQF